MNTVKIMQRLRPTTCSYRVVLIQPAGPALKRWQSNKIDPNEIGPKKLRPIQGWHTTLSMLVVGGLIGYAVLMRGDTKAGTAGEATTGDRAMSEMTTARK